MFNDPPGVIPSLDVDINEAIRIAENIKDLKQEIAGLKIGSVLAWRYGLPKIIGKIKDACDFPIIFDAQKAGNDIPDIVERQVKFIADIGIDAFIASPHGAGSETLDSFVKTCFEFDVIPIIVIEMTQPLSGIFLSGNASELIFKQALGLDVENFIAPANKVGRIEYYKDISIKLDKKIKIFSPGVGPQGGEAESAVKAGADFVIIGRSIYQAADPREAVVQAHNLMKKAIKNMPCESV
jgi:orotidine-5'-phosphate decarboxylase